MMTVPARVYFVATVFALSTVYVSQEAGYAFAQAGDNFRQPEMGDREFRKPPMGENKFGEDDRMRQPQEFKQQPGPFNQEGPEMQKDMQKGMQKEFSPEQSEEQQQKMEAQRAEQMKKQFAQMKKQFGQMGSMLKRVEARIAALEKQGVKAPADLVTAVAESNKALAVIQGAQSMDDAGVQEAMDTLQTNGQVLGDGMRNLEMLSQLPKMFKQANTEIKRLETAYTKSQKSAARLKVDVSSQLAEFRKAIDSIQAGYTSAQQLSQSGDAEGAIEALRSDVFENLQDANQYPGIIEALGNVRKYVANFDKFILKAAKNKLVLADSDATEALSEMKAKVAELKQLAVGTSDPDEIRSAVNEIFDLQSTVQNAMGTQQSTMLGPQNGNSLFDFSVFGQAGGL